MPESLQSVWSGHMRRVASQRLLPFHPGSQRPLSLLLRPLTSVQLLDFAYSSALIISSPTNGALPSTHAS
ncbi:hypothetical protein D3C85_1338120 [compost metagenome]